MRQRPVRGGRGRDGAWLPHYVIENLLAAAIGLGLLMYLLYALTHPDRF